MSVSKAVSTEWKVQQLTLLRPLIKAGLLKECTNHAIFNGSYDWHSAVHAHWALFRIAIVIDDPQSHNEALAVYKRFTPETLKKETELLNQHPNFEYPYGRAWLLRLAIDCEKWCQKQTLENNLNHTILRPIASGVADSLIKRIEALNKIDPCSVEYSNIPWALVQLYEFYEFIGSKEKMERVKNITTAILDNISNCSVRDFTSDHSSVEFFSPFGNLAYLIASVLDTERLMAFIKEYCGIGQNLDALKVKASSDMPVHVFGLNWSRAWALRSLSRRVDDKELSDVFERSFYDHVHQGMSDHDAIQKNYIQSELFYAYDHWVPQFAVYALSL